MRILVLGSGRMGQAVHNVATERDHDVLGPAGRGTYDRAAWADADVAIDFTHGSTVASNVALAVHHRLPIVVGTTAWADQRDQVFASVRDSGGTLVWGANFSLGFQLLVRAVAQSAALAQGLPGFNASIFEHHHAAKVDAPSGSALALAEVLNEEFPADKLPITSLRSGSQPGLHRVEFDGPSESVSIEHRVRDRRVFAEGAVFAAELAPNHQGVVRFGDLVADLLRRGGS